MSISDPTDASSQKGHPQPVTVSSFDQNGDPVTTAAGDPAATVLVGGNVADTDFYVNASGSTGVPFTKTFTIDGAADLFTTPSAPIAAELFTLTIPAGKRRCRVKWNMQRGNTVADIPWAAFVVATINAPDDTAALARLAVANNGVGDHTTDDIQRVLSADNPIITWDTQISAVDITRLDLGAIAVAGGTSTIPVYISVEAW